MEDTLEKEIHSRIIQYIRFKGLSVSVFCTSIGVSKAYLTKAIDFGVSKIVKIKMEYPDIAIEWLLFGKGDMFDLKNSKNTIEEESNHHEQFNLALLEIIKNKDKQIEDLIEDKKYLKDIIQLLKQEKSEIDRACS